MPAVALSPSFPEKRYSSQSKEAIGINSASITKMTDTSISIWQEVGRTWSAVKKLADTHFEVETPSASGVARGTLIDTTVDELGNTLMAVFEGALEVTAQGVSRTVEAGMQTFIEKGNIPGEPERIPLSRNTQHNTGPGKGGAKARKSDSTG